MYALQSCIHGLAQEFANVGVENEKSTAHGIIYVQRLLI